MNDPRAKSLSIFDRWRESIRGGGLFIVVPFICMFFFVVIEEIGVPKLVTIPVMAVMAVLFFGSFFRLIRIQYSRRQSEKDVFVAFLQCVLIVFFAFGLFGFSMIWIGGHYFS